MKEKTTIKYPAVIRCHKDRRSGFVSFYVNIPKKHADYMEIYDGDKTIVTLEAQG